MYLISASTLRSATSLAKRRGILDGQWVYIPWGNSYERELILDQFLKDGVPKNQLLGYFTDTEINDLTWSF
jgi:hypothetical protein